MSVQELILPMHPPLRRYAYDFTRRNFLHIPAIDHGFRTSQLFISVHDVTGTLLVGHMLFVDPCTYLVRVLFVQEIWLPDGPGTPRRVYTLLPPQSGRVVIMGPHSPHVTHPLSVYEGVDI